MGKINAKSIKVKSHGLFKISYKKTGFKIKITKRHPPMESIIAKALWMDLKNPTIMPTTNINACKK